MGVKATEWNAIPALTEQLARKSFRKPTAAMIMRDKLGPIFTNEDFAELFSSTGQPAYDPWRLALVTVMQYMLSMSDREAADAVSGRLDWKYALGLEADDEGFDASVLCEFRARLLEGDKITVLLDKVLEACRTHDLIKVRGQQRTDSTHVVGAVRALSRLELVMECMHHTLDEIAQEAPRWLSGQIMQEAPEWAERYGAQASNLRLPRTDAKRQALTEQIGRDGYELMWWLRIENVLSAAGSRYERRPLWELPAVETLRQVWIQQFYCYESFETGTEEQTHLEVSLRQREDMAPAALLICSPHDVEVRASRKRTTEWVGYMGHLTETCDEDKPHLIVHVEATPSTQRDHQTLDTIHSALAAKDLLPSVHYADSGYVTATQIVASENRDVELAGPVRNDTGWQAQTPDAYGLERFTIDWVNQQVTCPQGHLSRVWSKGRHGEAAVVRIQFDKTTCQCCPVREQCTTADTRGRSLEFRAEQEHLALVNARDQQHNSTFWKRYRKRAGIEGTISQAVNCCAMRRTRYIGLRKTALQLVLAATAINFLRLADWFRSDYKRAQTRTSAFAALFLAVAPNS